MIRRIHNRLQGRVLTYRSKGTKIEDLFDVIRYASDDACLTVDQKLTDRVIRNRLNKHQTKEFLLSEIYTRVAWDSPFGHIHQKTGFEVYTASHSQRFYIDIHRVMPKIKPDDRLSYHISFMNSAIDYRFVPRDGSKWF